MEDNKRYLILYHCEDNDGVFSAALVYVYLIHELKVDPTNITLEGMTYNLLSETYGSKEAIDELITKYDIVLMTDISFNDYKIMKLMFSTFGYNFIWIDHHRPIIVSSCNYEFDTISGIRDTSKSAILIAYQYLFDIFNEKYLEHKEPTLLRILSAYDSWSYEREKIPFKKCRDINRAVTIEFDRDINKVIPFVEDLIINKKDDTKFIQKMNKIGKVYTNYEDILNKTQLNEYGDFEWTVDGRKAVMIMTQGMSSSVMFKTLENTEYKNGIVLKYRPNGKWTLSLYNICGKYDKEFHCGMYLNKRFKGGGHAGAAGAEITAKQFTKIMKDKTI